MKRCTEQSAKKLALSEPDKLGAVEVWS
jgi:hypothetical protein